MIISLYAAVVLIIAAFALVLGAMILAQDFRNRSTQAFAMLAATAAAWGFGVGLYLLLPVSSWNALDLLARILYFAGTNTAPAFLYFALVFDAERPPPRWQSLSILAAAVVMLAIHLGTDLIIAAPYITPDGVRGFIYGPLRFLIDVELWGFFALALVVLTRRYRDLTPAARRNVKFILAGTYTSLVIGGTTNDILLNYGIFDYLWVGPAALIIWMSSIAYAIAKHHLFDIKVIATESLIVLLWVILLLRVVLSQGEVDFIINAGFFVAMLVLGMFLIRSVVKQVAQRELIMRQTEQLSQVNNQQEVLLHFISHEVKGYFTKSEAVFAGIGEGDFGIAPSALKKMAAHGLIDVRTGAAMAINILDASNLKKGTISYQKSYFDFYQATARVVETLRPVALQKGLTFNFVPGEGKTCLILGDETKITRHVIHNVIDNAIQFTLQGSVLVRMFCEGQQLRFVVEDTGVGITPEDEKVLFTEGGHGKDSLKVNVHSTGYGLFIAKQVVEAHGGTISARSDGAGKGSVFEVTLPITHPE